MARAEALWSPDSGREAGSDFGASSDASSSLRSQVPAAAATAGRAPQIKAETQYEDGGLLILIYGPREAARIGRQR